ncbi:MAG: hypothetical protein ACKPKO_05410, partial [Candidatus Fonsibacter sp.]
MMLNTLFMHTFVASFETFTSFPDNLWCWAFATMVLMPLLQITHLGMLRTVLSINDQGKDIAL